MKKTRRKNIVRNIRRSLNRFLSILFIVALGSGFMAGLAATSPDMYDTVDRYMDEYRLYDMDIKSTLGLTDDDISELSSLSYIERAQGARVTDMILKDSAEHTYTSRVYGILSDGGETELNKLSLTSGRFPENDGECVVQASSGRYFDGGIGIGDTLTVSRENVSYDSIAESVKTTVLTVVGFVESPMCISITSEPSTVGSGKIALNVYVKNDYFTYDYYTDIYASLRDAADLECFGDEYKTLVSETKDLLEKVGKVRAAVRTEEVRNKAEKNINMLRSVLDTVEDVRSIGRSLSEKTVSSLYINAASARVLAEKDPALAALLSETGENIVCALESTQDKSGEFLTSAAKVLSEAENEFSSLRDAVWLINTRDDSSGFSSYKSNVGKVAALSKIFPVFFFMVALLVALTTMTRLIEENRTEIGTLKALGFSNSQILGEYMLYSMLSSVLGCALGFSVGFKLFPRAISSAYSMMFTIPELDTPFRVSIAAWVAPVTIGSILLAAYLACRGESSASPAVLMQPKAPSPGKRIWLEHITPVWKRMTFTQKVTARNLFRYKKRFFMTVIGVAGCSALLLTGFGLRDSINDIVDKQFGEIYRYELSLMTDGDDDASDEELLCSPEIKTHMRFAEESGKVYFAKEGESLSICIPSDTSRFSEFITLRERKSKNSIDFPENGIVLTEKLCETLGIKVGDEVTIENADGFRADMTVTGICENYIASYAYISPDTYSKAFGEEASFTRTFCLLSENADSDALVSEIMTHENVIYASSSLSLKDSFADSIKSIDGVILVLILAAGLLCMVVLYNLTNVNVCERRKEFATIRVLGFHKKEVERYVFRETNILSFIGSVTGLFVGIWLHSFVVKTVEVDMVMFGRNIYPLSFIYALLISAVFTFIVNRMMARHIRRIDMVEAMKAND